MKPIFLEFQCPWRHEERYKNTKYFSWTNNYTQDIAGIFYFDEAIISGLYQKVNVKKFGWLCESRSITPNLISDIKNNYFKYIDNYDAIFTHEREICKLHKKFKFIENPSCVTWIKKPKLYKKTKLVSMISSNKNMCKGHEFRIKLANKLKNSLDLFGRGFNFISDKEEGLKDYMFSVTIENDSYETYFTEKILDCFACGTIPIYHGSPDIFEHFNKDGIIILDEKFEIESLSEKLYLSRFAAVEENFLKVLNLNLPENKLYENYFKQELG